MKEKVEAVIDEVIIQPSKIQPIIVNFQNGALKDDETNRMNCGVYHDAKEDKTVLAMSNGQVVYKGYRPETDKALTYTMLAIHNKRTGKIRLVQAERWQVAPVLDQQVEMDEEKNVMEKLNMLNKQFGSKKSKRITEQYEKMKVNIDSVKDQLEKTVSGVEINRDDLKPKEFGDDATDSSNFPHCNRDAETVDEVYKLYDIIPKDILKPLCKQIEENGEPELEGKSEFYLQTVKSLPSDSKRTKRIAILECIEAISTWLNMPFALVRKRVINDVYPNSVQLNNYVVDTFSMLGAKGRQRPNSMKDKGIMYCMVLALMICNFKLDIELFSKIISNHRSVKKFYDLARIIGAVPHKEDKNKVVLKVPLPPTLTMARRPKKK